MKEVAICSIGTDNYSGFGLLSLIYASFIYSICGLTKYIMHHTLSTASHKHCLTKAHFPVNDIKQGTDACGNV